MQLEEGQIYEGDISLSGSEGPHRRWIVISPFGRTHIHSLDDPLHLHCWPLSALVDGLKAGRVKLVDTAPEHPLIQLQRRKEAAGLADVHLGLKGTAMERMFELLETAVTEDAPYVQHAAGEIIAFAARSLYSEAELETIQVRVEGLLLRRMS